MKLCIASSNSGKIYEIRSLLPLWIKLIDCKQLGILEEIPETGATIEENALLKARYVFIRKQIPTLADDSGLFVEAINHRPGVHSARYAGNTKNAADNLQKLLHEMSAISHRKAIFRTTLAFINATGLEKTFIGTLKGTISQKPAGNHGFGYDPIFIPDGYRVTLSQLPHDTKNKLSHRAIAVKKFLDYLYTVRGN